jgi:hypothetical protein
MAERVEAAKARQRSIERYLEVVRSMSPDQVLSDRLRKAEANRSGSSVRQRPKTS